MRPLPSWALVAVAVLVCLPQVSPSLVTQGDATTPSNDLNRPLRVLWFTTWHVYTTMMDRDFPDSYNASRALPDQVEAHMWGVGFPGWDNERTIRDNLIRTYGSVGYFDMVIWWSMRHISTLMAGYHDAIDPDELNALRPDVVLAYREHESWDGKSDFLFSEFDTDVVFFAYAREIQLYAPYSVGRVLVHAPFLIDTKAFAPPLNRGSDEGHDTAIRPVDVLLTGNCERSVYPFRAKVKELIEQHRLGPDMNCVVHQHPGYPEGWNREKRSEQRIGLEWAERQKGDYIKALQTAKICVVTSSVYRYPLHKYIEAGMAGCLVVGDIPHEREEEYRQWVVEVPFKADAEHLAETIRWWLDHPDARRARIARGQAIIASSYDRSSFAETLRNAHTLYRSGAYGMVYTTPFRVGCSATNHYDGQWDNAWCSGSQPRLRLPRAPAGTVPTPLWTRPFQALLALLCALAVYLVWTVSKSTVLRRWHRHRREGLLPGIHAKRLV